MATMTIDDAKKEKIIELVKSLKTLDSCILPYQEQKKDLRRSYKENGWLTNEEFSMVKKAYNALKHNVDMDDLNSFIEICRKEMS